MKYLIRCVTILITMLFFAPSMLHADTDIYVYNYTPFDFTISGVQYGDDNVPDKRFKQLKTKIEAWDDGKVYNLARSKGVDNKKHYKFTITLKDPKLNAAYCADPLNNTPNPSLGDIGKVQLLSKITLAGHVVGSGISWAHAAALGKIDPNKVDVTRDSDKTWSEPAIIEVPNVKDPYNSDEPLKLMIRSRKMYLSKDGFKVIEKLADTFAKNTDGNLEYYISSVPNTKKTFATPASGSAANKLNVLTFNTYLLSIEIDGLLGLHFPGSKEGLGARSKRMADAIGSDYDVIVFNEIFDNDARKNVLKGLKDKGYRYSTCILGTGYLWDDKKKNPNHNKLNKPLKQPDVIDFQNEKFGKDDNYTMASGASTLNIPITDLGGIMNGGVLIVSKWPISDPQEIIYSWGTEADRWAKKGVLYAKINKSGKIYHVFGTHTNAHDSDVRASQLGTISNFINTDIKPPTTDPVLIAGDFNIKAKKDSDEYKNTLSILNAVHPEIQGTLKYSTDGFHNITKQYDDPAWPSLLDYVLYEKGYQAPVKSFNEIRPIVSNDVWNESINQDLSDHYAVYGRFEFPQ